MKKLAALLMIFSLALCNVGCEPAEEEPAGGAGVEADADGTAVDGTEADGGEVDGAG